MRRITLAAHVLSAALAVTVPCVALAQDAGHAATAPSNDASAAPNDGVQIDPATGERWRWVRPTDDMRRGLLPVSAWVAIAAGAALGIVAVVALVLRARRARRRP